MAEIDFVKDAVKAEIVPMAEPEVRLGSLAIESPTDLVRRATELAKALADIIEQQKLYVVIQKRKYVKAEGWLCLGAMLGVVPIEDYCRPLPEHKGFESKINLIRAKDGGMVGSASAECTYSESNWEKRDSYSLRSMSLTRATGKAFRLSFGWIMKLANYEATPAEEMMHGKEEDAKAEVEAEVDRQQKEHAANIEKQNQARANGKSTKPAPCLFYTIPESHNGHFAEFLNINEFGSELNEVAHQGLLALFKPFVSRTTGSGTVLVSTAAGKLDVLLAELEKVDARTKKLEAR